MAVLGETLKDAGIDSGMMDSCCLTTDGGRYGSRRLILELTELAQALVSVQYQESYLWWSMMVPITEDAHVWLRRIG